MTTRSRHLFLLAVATALPALSCGGNIVDSTGYTVDTYCDHGNRVYHSDNGSIAVVAKDASCDGASR
jgi:hypothetical protein